MKIGQLFQFAIATLVAISLFILLASPVFATGNQSDREMARTAILIAPDPKFQINIYPKPDTNQQRIGYGLSGDRVTVLEQFGSNEGDTWKHIRFEKSSIKGWVQGDFVDLSNDRTNQYEYNSGDRYLGNRQNSYQNYQKNQPQNHYYQQQ